METVLESGGSVCGGNGEEVAGKNVLSEHTVVA